MNLYEIELNDGKAESFKYPAGEIQVRFSKEEAAKIEKADKILVTARVTSSDDVIKLCLLTNAIQFISGGTERVLILPYLPYSRADRRFTNEDCFGLKIFGRIINDLAYDEVVTFDVHSDKAKKYIHNLINVEPTSLIHNVLSTLPKDTVILFPDEGAANRYGKDFKNVFFCEKERDPVTGKLLKFKLPEGIYQKTETVFIVDDLCDGGGTFIGIAEQLPNLNLYLYVSHGIFSHGLSDLNKHFLTVFTTDSFPSIGKNLDELVVRTPVGGLIKGEILTKEEVWKSACPSS